ncbi:hypothetical protein SAMN05660649_04208 [Desulfotomaculum arcticum]|uniref:Uncharacterized protein n=1 Tax=Desulfotruncus arcticus DSM 17038 TaxID=1121424 RepID=A0A1I2XZH5_9FIRM|nr:hypothetical protein [Desulfotruncus arcticus]SFH18803.1 hypothetical protein SAMN05660649_04208 [Desulfotomaculum arcticum] [Desulfotruncus arcticus DSM 17038]
MMTNKAKGSETLGLLCKTFRYLFISWVLLIIISLLFWQEPLKTAFSLIVIPFIYIITKLQGGSADTFACGKASAFHAIYSFALIIIPIGLILIRIVKKKWIAD